MNYKFLLGIFYALAWVVLIETRGTFKSDIETLNEWIVLRESRSFGCNGPDRRNPRRCKLHCQSRNFRTGQCSQLSGYTRCVCHNSVIPTLPPSKP